MEGTPPASMEAAIQSCLLMRIITQAGTPAKYTTQPAIFNCLLVFCFFPSAKANKILFKSVVRVFEV